MSEAADAPFLLYGVCAAATATDAGLPSSLQQTGVADAPLSLLTDDALALLRSPVDPATLREAEPPTVLTYRDVVAAAYDRCPVVPLQFGTTIERDEQGRALLARHRTALEQHLDRFAGRVEVGVRLVLTTTGDAGHDVPKETGSGTAYLEARRDERARQTARRTRIIEAYQQAVGPACVEATCDRKPGQDDILSLAFLVPRDQAESVWCRLADVSAEAVEEAHVVGPWAPYSFSTLPSL